MKILKLYPEIDTLERYNYRVNYGVWDVIQGDKYVLERFPIKQLDEYDIVFLPQIKRWRGKKGVLEKIKAHKIKTVLFDNDSCYRLFTDDLYDGIDFIFYRDLDKNRCIPSRKNQNSCFLLWSINTGVYAPKYGGGGVLFNCAINNSYPLRLQINQQIKKVTRLKKEKYITAIQNSAAAIHTDSIKVPAVRFKILEFAACGTQIISNRTQNMNLYFPDELIIYFDSIEHLKEIITNFHADKKIQKQLREITVEKHDDRVRAKQVLEILSEVS